MMSTFKITIEVPEDVYNRVKRLAPRKEWGENHKRDFYSKIFLNGLEHPDYLKAENRRLETLLKILKKSFLKPEFADKADIIDDLARQVEQFEDMAKAKPAATANGNGSSPHN